MKSRTTCIAVLLSAAMLFTACHKERSANDLVEAFLDSCLVDNAISDLTFTSLDSTRYINDSVIGALRLSMLKSAVFKKDVSYGHHDAQQPLHYISATYKKSNGEKVRQTFYIDKLHTAVICVKNDYVADEY